MHMYVYIYIHTTTIIYTLTQSGSLQIEAISKPEVRARSRSDRAACGTYPDAAPMRRQSNA